jgi:hypothetical protein
MPQMLSGILDIGRTATFLQISRFFSFNEETSILNVIPRNFTPAVIPTPSDSIMSSAGLDSMKSGTMNPLSWNGAD